MTEEKEDLVTFKIRSSQREWAEDEQTRLKRLRRQKVTQAELFDLLRAAYAGGAASVARAPVFTEDQADIIAMLELKEFPFPGIRKLVYDGLENYRKNHKKTASARHERKPA